MTTSASHLLLVGYIPKAHGVRGEVKVAPETVDPSHFEALPTVYVGDEAEDATAYPVETVRYQHSKRGVTVLLKLSGVDSPEEATATLAKRYVYADEVDLPDAEDDGFLPDDLIGLMVTGEDGATLGTIKDVLELPGHDVLVIARDEAPDALVPAVPEFVTGVDPEAGTIVIRPIEGLL